MTTTGFMRIKEKPLTELALRVLRCRLSLRETQKKFAERFHVSPITVYNWERGKTVNIPAVYDYLLTKISEKLVQEGRLIPEDIIITMLRERKDGLD